MVKDQNVSEQVLDKKIKTLAQNERDLLADVLKTIRSIERQHSYLKLGYSSLFDYLVKEVGYSAGSAQRRIDGARVLQEIPAIEDKINSGELQLQHISLVQKSIRAAERYHDQKVSPLLKEEILGALVGKSRLQAEQTVADMLNLPVIEKQIMRAQADASMRIEFTISREVYEQVQYAKSLVSHSLETQDLIGFLKYTSQKIIKDKTAVKAKPEVKTEFLRQSTDSESTATVAVKDSVRRHLLQTQKYCQFRDPVSRKLCGSTHFLQVDHIKPKWAGGGNHPENLQLLCQKHNLLKYKTEAGIQSSD